MTSIVCNRLPKGSSGSEHTNKEIGMHNRLIVPIGLLTDIGCSKLTTALT